jgi:hypothetical protein
MSLQTRTTAPLIAAALLALTACASPSGGSPGKDEQVCDAADKKVVSDVMSKARTNFTTGKSVTDHFELVEARTAPIPQDKQEFGAERLMVLLVKVFIDDKNIPEGFQGAQGPVYVTLDADGEPLAPLGTDSQPFFDIEPPAEPGWTAWADGIATSDVAYDLFGCVNPN